MLCCCFPSWRLDFPNAPMMDPVVSGTAWEEEERLRSSHSGRLLLPSCPGREGLLWSTSGTDWQQMRPFRLQRSWSVRGAEAFVGFVPQQSLQTFQEKQEFRRNGRKPYDSP